MLKLNPRIGGVINNFSNWFTNIAIALSIISMEANHEKHLISDNGDHPDGNRLDASVCRHS